MFPFSTAWLREARALSGLTLALAITMFAHMEMGVVETLIVARLGVHELAGVTLAIGLYSLLFLFALGVVTAVTPIAATAHGNGDRADLRRIGQQGILVGLTFAFPSLAGLLACAALAEAVMGPGVEAHGLALYLSGAAWGLPAWVTYVAIRCLGVATGRARVTTLAMLGLMPVQAGATWLLVFGGCGLPALGVFGAGLADTVTGFVGLGLIGVIVAVSPMDAFSSVFRRPLEWDPARYGALVRLGVPFAVRIVLREGLLPAMALLIAPFGAAAIVAHAVAMRVLGLIGMFSFGFSGAANARVGQALGAGTPGQARRAGWVAIQLSTTVSVVMAAALMIAPERIAQWILDDADPTGLAVAVAVLPLAAAVECLEGMQAAAGGALAGMRDAKGPLVISILGFWVLAVPLGCVLARVMTSPVEGMWWGLVVGELLVTGLYLARFRRKMGAD